MIAGSVARRYARALLEIGMANHAADALGKELERVADLMKGSAELRAALENPVFALSKRKALVEELVRRLALSRTVRNFVLLLLERGRVGALPDIAREYRAFVDEAMGRVRVTVTSARPLDGATEIKLKTMLEKRTGKVVLLEKKEDAALLGGIVTQIGDMVYDGSVRTALATLKHELLAAR